MEEFPLVFRATPGDWIVHENSATTAKPEAQTAAFRLGRQQVHVIWDHLRTSLWFVPGIMVLVAFGLVLVGSAADAWLARRSPERIPFFVYVSMPGAARDVLSTLLSSMITMTSLVFSITMVVLTLAANQFGPRLIRNFMALPNTQLALGTFIMTTVYCLLSLGVIGSRSSHEVQAFPSISLAIALALVSIGVLVMFLHSLARSIVSETVIKRVGGEVDEIVSHLKDAVPQEEEKDFDAESALPADFDDRSSFFGPMCDGYVQAVEMESLISAAQKADVVIGLSFRPGDYVAMDGGGVGVYPASRCSDELKARILEAILIGRHRTPNQDPEFAIRHLVEIAVRALSPGINDPYTAAAVVDQLSASLSRLMAKALPHSVMRDDKGSARLVAPRPSYASIIGAAFNQIRQNGADKPLVVIHLLEAIIRIADHVRLETQRTLLSEHLDAIVEAAHREIIDAFDKTAVDERAEAARKILRAAL